MSHNLRHSAEAAMVAGTQRPGPPADNPDIMGVTST